MSIQLRNHAEQALIFSKGLHNNALLKQCIKLEAIDLTKEIYIKQVEQFEKIAVQGDTKAQRIILFPANY